MNPLLHSARRRERLAGRSRAFVLGEVDLVRALGLAGVRSVVVAQPGNPARYSRHTAARLPWIDPWRDPGRLADALCAAAEAEPAPPALYYDGDWDLLLVSRARDRLRAAGLRFVVADAELVEDVLDKARFQELADRHGLPVPRAERLAAGADPRTVGLSFPLVAKPLIRQHATWRPIVSAKAVRLRTGAELGAIAREAGRAGVDVLLQEEVEGPESAIESYHVYVRDDGSVAGEFTGRKVRTYPETFGYSTLLETTDAADVRAAGRDFVDAVALRGVAKLDFKRARDGRLYLLEANLRFNLWHHLGAVAGLNLPALVHADLLGLPAPAQRAVRPGVRWCSIRHDFLAARHAGVGVPSWTATVLRARARSGFALDDPWPLPAALLWRARRRAAGAVSAAVTPMRRHREA